jgi:hypothetical protein
MQVDAGNYGEAAAERNAVFISPNCSFFSFPPEFGLAEKGQRPIGT